MLLLHPNSFNEVTCQKPVMSCSILCSVWQSQNSQTREHVGNVNGITPEHFHASLSMVAAHLKVLVFQVYSTNLGTT